MSEIPTCHPGDYRRGRGILWNNLAVGEVFTIVGGGRIKLRTYVKSCPDHGIAIASVPYMTHASEAEAEVLWKDCAREHYFEIGQLALLAGVVPVSPLLRRCVGNFEEASRVRPLGRRLFVPDAEAEANWKRYRPDWKAIEVQVGVSRA